MTKAIEKKRILVTGGFGFIGSHLVEKLCSLGGEVWVLDNLSTALPSTVALLRNQVKGFVQREQTEVFSSNHLLDLGHFDYVFHLASVATVYDAVARPAEDFNSNYRATFLLLEQLRKLTVRPKLIYASSAAVYGENREAPSKETDVTDPISPYGVSKLASDRMVSVYAKLYDISAVTMRFFPTYGPRQRKQVVYDLIHRMHENPDLLQVRAPASYKRDFIYVADLIEGLLLATTIPGNGEAYNIASGGLVTLGTLAETIARVSHLRPTIQFAPEAAKSDAYTMSGNIEKLSKYGFRPCVSFESGIQQTVEWYRSEISSTGQFRKTG